MPVKAPKSAKNQSEAYKGKVESPSSKTPTYRKPDSIKQSKPLG